MTVWSVTFTSTLTRVPFSVTTIFLASASTDLTVPSNSSARAGSTSTASATSPPAKTRTQERRVCIGGVPQGVWAARGGRVPDRERPREPPPRRRPTIDPGGRYCDGKPAGRRKTGRGVGLLLDGQRPGVPEGPGEGRAGPAPVAL